MKLKRVALLPLLVSTLVGCVTTTSVEEHDGGLAVITTGWALFFDETELLEENDRQVKVACTKKTSNAATAALGSEAGSVSIGKLEKILFSQRIVSWIGKCK